MSTPAGKANFVFDCIVEQSRPAPLGGRFAIVVALLLCLVALAMTVPEHRAAVPTAGTPDRVRAG